jgi:hypothetical protein
MTGDQVKVDKVGDACAKCVGAEKYIQVFGGEI